MLAGDVAEYSRLIDEEGTLAQLKAHRRVLVDPKIAEHRGRIVRPPATVCSWSSRASWMPSAALSRFRSDRPDIASETVIGLLPVRPLPGAFTCVESIICMSVTPHSRQAPGIDFPKCRAAPSAQTGYISSSEDRTRPDMLLEALVACAGVTLKAVAMALGIAIRSGTVSAEGDLDFRGTLGVAKDAPVGFAAIRLTFTLDTEAAQESLDQPLKLTERYCVVYQTIRSGPPVEIAMKRA